MLLHVDFGGRITYLPSHLQLERLHARTTYAGTDRQDAGHLQEIRHYKSSIIPFPSSFVITPLVFVLYFASSHTSFWWSFFLLSWSSHPPSHPRTYHPHLVSCVCIPFPYLSLSLNSGPSVQIPLPYLSHMPPNRRYRSYLCNQVRFPTVIRVL